MTMFLILVSFWSKDFKNKKTKNKKRFLPPGALCLSHTNTSLQVGPGLRFTVETQKQESVSHFVKRNDRLSLEVTIAGQP